MEPLTDCPQCGTPVEKILGAVVVFDPALEFTTCTNCKAVLVRTSEGAWSLKPADKK